LHKLKNTNLRHCCDRKSRAARVQSFAPWQQATLEITRRDHSIIACSRHIHVFLFFAHIPFVMNHTINATPPERLQQHQTQTRFCHFFAVSVSRWGRVLRLQVGKVAFACYSISSRSSLIRLAWEQYKLAQVLNSNLISE